jgi:hypothetical protein
MKQGREKRFAVRELLQALVDAEFGDQELEGIQDAIWSERQTIFVKIGREPCEETEITFLGDGRIVANGWYLQWDLVPESSDEGSAETRVGPEHR